MKYIQANILLKTGQYRKQKAVLLDLQPIPGCILAVYGEDLQGKKHWNLTDSNTGVCIYRWTGTRKESIELFIRLASAYAGHIGKCLDKYGRDVKKGQQELF